MICILEKSKNIVVATAVATLLTGIFPNSASGKDSQDVADMKASIICVSAMISINPKDPVLYFERGLMYKYVEAYDSAAKDLKKVEELNYPYYRFDLVWLRALCNYKAGNYYKAVEDYNYALKIHPRSDFCYANRALAFKALKRYRLAIEDCNKAIKLNSNESEPFSTAGECYYRTGRYQHAIEFLNKAINRDPKNATAFYFRGASFLKLGQKASADHDLLRAKQLGYKKRKG